MCWWWPSSSFRHLIFIFILFLSYCPYSSLCVSDGKGSDTVRPTPTQLLEIASKSQLTNVLSKHDHVVLLYYASWCRHSHTLSSALRQASTVFTLSDLVFGRVKETKKDHIAALYEEANVTAVPSLHFLQRNSVTAAVHARGAVKNEATNAGNIANFSRIIYRGNRTVVAIAKWLYSLRYGDEVVTLYSTEQAYAFASLNLPTAVGWLQQRQHVDKHVSTKDTIQNAYQNTVSLLSSFKQSCTASDKVLCGIFLPHRWSDEHVQLTNLVASPKAKYEPAGQESVTIPYVRRGSQSPFVLFWSTISIFPSVRKKVNFFPYFYVILCAVSCVMHQPIINFSDYNGICLGIMYISCLSS